MLFLRLFRFSYDYEVTCWIALFVLSSFSSCVLFLRLHRWTGEFEVNCKIDLRSDLHAPNMFGSTCIACDGDKSSRQSNSGVPSFLTCRISYSYLWVCDVSCKICNDHQGSTEDEHFLSRHTWLYGYMATWSRHECVYRGSRTGTPYYPAGSSTNVKDYDEVD